MIVNLIRFKPSHIRHIRTFNGSPDHWDGTCTQRTALRGAIRAHYLKQQEYHCAYCGRIRQDWHGYNWDIDHIIPKSTHPQFTYEAKNYAITCKECNITKDNKNVLSEGVNASVVYPEIDDHFIIIHPHFDDFQDHLSLMYNHKHQVYHRPITQKGIDTISICGLNRFIEDIAETSEFIEESNISIGFVDDKFLKLFEGFQAYVSSYVTDPALKSSMFTRHLALEAGIETDELLAAIADIRSRRHNVPDTRADQSIGPQPLPPPANDEE